MVPIRSVVQSDHSELFGTSELQAHFSVTPVLPGHLAELRKASAFPGLPDAKQCRDSCDLDGVSTQLSQTDVSSMSELWELWEEPVPLLSGSQYRFVVRNTLLEVSLDEGAPRHGTARRAVSVPRGFAPRTAAWETVLPDAPEEDSAEEAQTAQGPKQAKRRSARGAVARPNRNRRLVYRRYVDELEAELRRDPACFNFESLRIPNVMSKNSDVREFLADKLSRRLQQLQAELLGKDRHMEPLTAPRQKLVITF